MHGPENFPFGGRVSKSTIPEEHVEKDIRGTTDPGLHAALVNLQATIEKKRVLRAEVPLSSVSTMKDLASHLKTPPVVSGKDKAAGEGQD